MQTPDVAFLFSKWRGGMLRTSNPEPTSMLSVFFFFFLSNKTLDPCVWLTSGWYCLNLRGFEKNPFVSLGRASRAVLAKPHCPYTFRCCPHPHPQLSHPSVLTLERQSRVMGPPAQMGFHLFPLVASATAVRRASSHWVTSLFHHIMLALTTLVLRSHGCLGRGFIVMVYTGGACSDWLLKKKATKPA